MVSNDRLWETMEKRKISQYLLVRRYHFSSGQLHRIRKNEHVSTHTLEALCRILNCGVSDIVRVSFDHKENEA